MQQVHAKREIGLLIFDLDGTLIDSRQDLANSVNLVRRNFNLPEFSLNEVMEYVGDGAQKLIQRAFPNKSQEGLDKALNIFKAHYQKHIFDNTVLYPGVSETLSYFKNKKKAIISNKPVLFTQQIAEQLFPGIFDLVLGGDSLPEKKPSPEPILNVLTTLNISEKEAVIVGDGSPDIESGKAAGISTCAVTYGFRTKTFLMRYEPEYCIDSFQELKDVFE